MTAPLNLHDGTWAPVTDEPRAGDVWLLGDGGTQRWQPGDRGAPAGKWSERADVLMRSTLPWGGRGDPADHATPAQVAMRELDVSVCCDPGCDLSGGYAHAGDCEPCGCGKRHARVECPRPTAGDEVRAAVRALPPKGGTISYYSWDRAEHDEQMAALESAAFHRGFVLKGWSSGNGHLTAQLVPRGVDPIPVRCCAGQRGRGRKKARFWRARANLYSQAYAYRDRVAKTIGWNAAVKDPVFQDLLRQTTRGRWGRR